MNALRATLLALLLAGPLSAQRWYEASDTLSRQRAGWLNTGQAVGFVGAQGMLYFMWYAQYDQEPFHLFDDRHEWMGMDKSGHVASTYLLSSILYRTNRWAGMSVNRATWQAVAVGYSFQTAFEVMDGFSSGWGFSLWDVAANTTGASTFLAQQLLWKEQRIGYRYSFYPSGLHDLPDPEGQRADDLYGADVFQQWLKDYNGQTHWVSANLWSLCGKPDRFPKWLNISLGHSANNLLGANGNSWIIDGSRPYTSALQPEHQWLLAFDVDLNFVDLPPYLHWLRPVIGTIHIPGPALEWNSIRGWQGHYLYF